jgi:hypothetical protein
MSATETSKANVWQIRNMISPFLTTAFLMSNQLVLLCFRREEFATIVTYFAVEY